MTKTQLMRGFQCPKSLYLTVHQPHLETPPDAKQLSIFDQGREVEGHARKEFPNGVLIHASDMRQAIRETAAAIQAGELTLFEATFEFAGILVRVDILTRPAVGSPWELIEIKSAASFKAEYVDDIGIQWWVLRSLGIPVSKATVMYLNKDATAPRLENLFLRKTAIVNLDRIQSKLLDFKNVLKQPQPPPVDIGLHCSNPHPCGFLEHCWKHIASPSIFDFPAIYKEVWEFYRAGIRELSDPRFGPFEGVAARRLEAIRSGKRWVDAEQIQAQMKDWKWPLLFLDFETINYAIPRYPGTRPYEQVPFQFSLLIQKERNGEFEALEYLHTDATDPRPPLMALLAQALRREGNIVAYYKQFEGACLKALADCFPGPDAGVLLSAVERLVDPLPLIRSTVYDPQFGASFSIKSVAPALLGASASYEHLEVADGAAAQRAFLELIHPSTPPDRKLQLEQAMLAYCKQDTQVMLGLVAWLSAQVSDGPRSGHNSDGNADRAGFNFEGA